MNNNSNEISPEGQSRRDFFKVAGVSAAAAGVVVTGVGGLACALNPQPKPKVEGFIGKAVRRVRQSIRPTPASVRWDGAVNMWAVLDSNLRPVRHFTHGTISQVSFSSKLVSKLVPGCTGGSSTEHVGVASGLLRENHVGSAGAGWRNLKFKDGHFMSYEEQQIADAGEVILMPDRHAMYKA